MMRDPLGPFSKLLVNICISVLEFIDRYKLFIIIIVILIILFSSCGQITLNKSKNPCQYEISSVNIQDENEMICDYNLLKVNGTENCSFYKDRNATLTIRGACSDYKKGQIISLDFVIVGEEKEKTKNTSSNITNENVGNKVIIYNNTNPEIENDIYNGIKTKIDTMIIIE